MITKFLLFERKGNYQLFHKTQSLDSIIKSGYIIAGGDDEERPISWDVPIRKEIFPNMDKHGPKTISATRNLDYMSLPALELDVEKISDRYKIIPYSENPDFYLDFSKKHTIAPLNKNLTVLQRQLRSKDAGELYWRPKTNKRSDDYGIAEEIIVADKLDVEKYVKRIILNKYNKEYEKLIKKKYPNIEVVIIDKSRGYSDIKKAIKQKERQKELVYQESFDYEDDPRDDDPSNKYKEFIGYGKFIVSFPINWIEPTLRGLIRDNVDFDFYSADDGYENSNYLIILKGDWKNKLINNTNLFPSTNQDQWYISPITGSDWYGSDWKKIDDVEIFLDANKYNL